MFKDCRWARMSDGHFCLVRDLGLVKGGKGLRHHEVVLDLSLRGMKVLAKQGVSALATKAAAKLAACRHVEMGGAAAARRARAAMSKVSSLF